MASNNEIQATSGRSAGVGAPSPKVGAVDMTRRMVCGGLAGMIAKTATAPLERIKMLSQTGEHGVKHTASSVATNGAATASATATKSKSTSTSVIQLYRTIVQNEGIIGLWAGNGANLLRIFPAKGVVFASNDYYKSMLRSLSYTPSDQALNGSLSFLAGGMSGMTASALTYPLDFARGRISGKVGHAKMGQKHYSGIWNTMYLSVKEEGFFALYKGITPTLLGAMPYEGIKFGTVGVLEKYFPHDPEQGPPSVWRKIMFGGLGGVMAGVITYPNDTIRRMLQLQGSRGTTEVFDGYWDCVRKTYRSHGIQRFYHGVGINLIRMAPNTAVQFGSYELLKRLSEGMVF